MRPPAFSRHSLERLLLGQIFVERWYAILINTVLHLCITFFNSKVWNIATAILTIHPEVVWSHHVSSLYHC